MSFAAAHGAFPDAQVYQAMPRLSAGGLALIVAAHAGLLGWLARHEAPPAPQPEQALMVQVLPPSPVAQAAPRPEPSRPRPAERPAPARPAPRVVTANATAPATAVPVAPAPTAASPAAPHPPASVVPAAAPALSPARFDVDTLQNPAPAYPSLSRRLGEEGKVMLRVFVEAAGLPGRIEIKASSGSPRLDQAAVDAVRRWKFVPARRGEEAVGAWVLVPILFNLRG